MVLKKHVVLHNSQRDNMHISKPRFILGFLYVIISLGDNMELYKGNNWEVVFVDWCQEFVGDCIISCNKESLSELSTEDWKELGLIEKELERVCKKVFNATMFNFA